VVILTGARDRRTMRCLIPIGDHPKPMIAPGNWNHQVLPGNAFAAIRITTEITARSRVRNPILS